MLFIEKRITREDARNCPARVLPQKRCGGSPVFGPPLSAAALWLNASLQPGMHAGQSSGLRLSSEGDAAPHTLSEFLRFYKPVTFCRFR
jgi:hypothetical protein